MPYPTYISECCGSSIVGGRCASCWEGVVGEEVVEDVKIVTAADCTYCHKMENVKKMRLYKDGQTLLCKSCEERLSEAAPNLLQVVRHLADTAKDITPQFVLDTIANASPSSK